VSEALPDGKGPEVGGPPPPGGGARGRWDWGPSVVGRLFAEAHQFDFFQAVRVLHLLNPRRQRVGEAGPPRDEVVHFRAHLSLAFPASAIYSLEGSPAPDARPPLMTVTFLGLTGPSGVLPRHYTELLLNLDRDVRGPERYALRAWLDLFNHRLASLFFRAWEKYRFPLAHEHPDFGRAGADPFTQVLFSLVGLGYQAKEDLKVTPALRRRLAVTVPAGVPGGRPAELARIDDLALLHYGGLLAARGRSAVGLRALLEDYFGLPVQVQQFRGRWLLLEPADQSRLGGDGGSCALGVNAVAGERVWDVQSKVRLRLGPLSFAQFTELLPDRSPVAQRKMLFLVAHLTRLYLGPELDFEVQLVLRAREVPGCRLAGGGRGGSRLGWDSWVQTAPPRRDADDAVFEGEEVYRLTTGESRANGQPALPGE
jgi:type VI secretion system protein ImpH